MSIVDENDQRVHPAPQPYRARPVDSPVVRRRNRRWLERKLRDDLTIWELAKALGKPKATVAAGVLWAEEDEQRGEEKLIASFQSPVLCRATGMTVDDAIFLEAMLPPGTEAGDHPLVREVLDPIIAKLHKYLAALPEEALPWDEATPTSAEAA